MAYTGNMEADLKILLPHIVADGISREHSGKLVSIARRVYRANARWAKKITDTEKGRDLLYAFMAHWFEGFQKTGQWIGETKQP